ncbi:cytochrome P450 [Streptomyces sp. NRRL F-5727]|uniref:cytochrome P450 n=1 Tax=Streptomyces sp. NRRL F-5727 TaxID=1463871 RepID=UPI000AA3766D|nr:cytochrome P450 [Streptomyces sp. NRRL F-5727]
MAEPAGAGTADPLGLPLELLDLFGDSFVRDPHPWLDRLRSEAPVHHDPATGLWLVSRHQDIRHVLLDTDTYLPDNAQSAVTPLPVAVMRILVRAGFRLPPALANNGTPSHPGLRRVVARFFDPRSVAAAVPAIERIARELLDELTAGATDSADPDPDLDLFGSFAQILPCRVLMELLGIHGVDPATLIAWSDASLELFWGRPTPARQLELAELVAEFHQWLAATVRGDTAPPGSFVAALAAHRLPDGTPLDVDTAVAACFFVFVAGQSTTGQLLATVLRSALAEPGVWPRAAAEPGLAEAWVEEVLRREPPVTTWRRVTARPTRLGGMELPAGAHVLLMLMGSGSDPELFPDPARMCPGRGNARRHLAFGAGRHLCPGATLARTEAAVALRAAARRLPGVRPADASAQPPMLGLLSFRAPLQVRVER